MNKDTANQDIVMEFLGRVAADNAAAVAGLSVSLGARLGLYAAMAGAGKLTSQQLADRTGLNERYVREWLDGQVAGQYVVYGEEGGVYELPAEHAAVLADPSSPVHMAGGFRMLAAVYAIEDKLADAFHTGEGVDWSDYGPGLAEGTAASFRSGYAANLVQDWLPKAEGVVRRLDAGAKVADVGCGFGHTTLLMAAAFPNSRFHGFDFHGPSMTAARKAAAEQGLAERVSFEQAAADAFPGDGYDLITFFDCLHDLGDPGAALAQAERALADGGSCLIVEPNSQQHPNGNISPVGRAFAATSVAVCLPVALAQHGPHALGNHAGELALRDIAAAAGLRTWRLAAETITNRVYHVSR